MKNFFFGLIFCLAIAAPTTAAVTAPQSEQSVKQEQQTALIRFRCSWVNGIPICRFVG